MNKRFLEFDSLRGIAAILIMLGHYTSGFSEKYPIFDHASKIFFNITFQRQIVYFFFLLSGFFIILNISKKNAISFAINRFFRLYPVYWASLIIIFVVVSIFGLPGREVSFFAFLFNFTMLQNFFRIPHVDSVFWTLEKFLVFYFLIFLVLLLNKKDKIKDFTLYWILLAFILSFLYKLNLFNYFPFVQKILFTFFLPVYASFFTLGILLSFYLVNKKFILKDYIILILSFFNIYLEFPIITLIFFIFFFLLSIFIIHVKIPIFSNKLLLFLGEISFALYLIHQNIGFVIIRLFYLNNLNPNLAILLSSILSIFLAYILTYYIEKPINSFVKKHLKF